VDNCRKIVLEPEYLGAVEIRNALVDVPKHSVVEVLGLGQEGYFGNDGRCSNGIKQHSSQSSVV